MKHIVRIFLALAVLTLARSVTAQSASDNAAQSAYTNGWATGKNGGFGFYPWILTNDNDSANLHFSGSFVGSSAGATGVGTIDTTNKSFGLYANDSSVTPIANYSVGYRGLSNALNTSVVFTIKMKNGFIDNIIPGVVGFSLLNGTNILSSQDPSTMVSSARFSFYFTGGNNNFSVFDAAGVFDTGIPFTAGGLTLQLTLRGSDTYLLTVKDASGATTLTNFDGRTLRNSGTVDSFAIFNFDAGAGGSHDAYFNQFSVAPASLIPPEIQNVTPANNSFYVATGTPVTFNVFSAYANINTNTIKLSLNGTNITGLSVTGDLTNRSVSVTPALVRDQIYNAVITAADNNGNNVTNTFSFNTWNPLGFIIEAEAYNYTNGNFVAKPGSQYDSVLAPAVNGVDFLTFASHGGTNSYRPQDTNAVEISGDPTDHSNYLLNGRTNWSLDYIQGGEWENYTRHFSNTTYTVYARISSSSGSPVVRCERLASPTATTSNQPLASLGTFVGYNTGDIVSNYAFVPLKDFFSSNVLVRFSTTNATTNTLRLTRISDSYNLDYLLFVPSGDTNTQRPYLSAGYPFPGATGVEPDQQFSVTIANRQTTVNPASIQLFINGTNVTAGIVTSNNAAGCAVTYTPSPLYPPGSNITAKVVFTDSASVTQTNTWQFSVVNIPVIPAGYALASGSTRGFTGFINKASNQAPDSQYVATPERAEAQLANQIINTNTSLPWPNEALGPNNDGSFTETNTINYDQVGGNGGSIPGDTLYPYIPATLLGSYTNDPNHFAFAATGYALLSPGVYKWGVRCDDGFRLTTGTGATPTNLVIAGGGSYEFEFVVQAAGYYPIRLLHYEATAFASVEFYSINRTNGAVILINDRTNAAAVQVFQSSVAPPLPVTLLNPARAGSTATFNFLTQSGKTHTVQYKKLLSDASWITLITVTGNGGNTNISDTTATNATRFYRVGTQ
jgi:hypothetical protein